MTEMDSQGINKKRVIEMNFNFFHFEQKF